MQTNKKSPYFQNAVNAVFSVITNPENSFKTPHECETAIKNAITKGCTGLTKDGDIALKQLIHAGIQKACTTHPTTFKGFRDFCTKNPTVTNWLKTKVDRLSRNIPNNGFLHNIVLGISFTEGMKYKETLTKDELINKMTKRVNNMWPNTNHLQVTPSIIKGVVSHPALKRTTLEIVDTVVKKDEKTITNAYTTFLNETVPYTKIVNNIESYVNTLYATK